MAHGARTLAGFGGVLEASCMIAAPGAQADSVQSFRSSLGSVDIYTGPGGDIGVNVTEFDLSGDNSEAASTLCGFDALNTVLYRHPELATQPGIHFETPLPIDGSGNGTAQLGPVQNGTYDVTIYCSGPDANGNHIGDRNGDPLTPWAVKVVVDGHPTRIVTAKDS